MVKCAFTEKCLDFVADMSRFFVKQHPVPVRQSEPRRDVVEGGGSGSEGGAALGLIAEWVGHRGRGVRKSAVVGRRVGC